MRSGRHYCAIAACFDSEMCLFFILQKRLSHSSEVFQQFATLGITAPSTPHEAEQCMQLLTQKKVVFVNFILMRAEDDCVNTAKNDPEFILMQVKLFGSCSLMLGTKEN